MVIETAAIIAFSMVLATMIAFLYLRDNEMKRKLLIYEKAIEELNKKLYYLGENREEELFFEIGNLDVKIKDVEKKLYNKLDDLGDPILKTIQTVRGSEEKFIQIQQDLYDRIKQLEDKIKKVTSLSAVNSSIDENKIVDMYKQGLSVDEIAKHQRVPQGEVELILRLANLR